MNSLLTESLIALADLPELLPAPSRPSPRTVRRWTTHGITGIKLEAVRIGGELYTSREAFQRWIERVNAARELRYADEAATVAEPAMA
jgi:hypothetical protein